MKYFISAIQSLARATRDPLFRKAYLINAKLDAARNYQPPKSTISDHLKDCFGWITC